ncbi:hypothetical protein BGW80DRAFT_303506 [Lactifluus volemus]|nr:hypothetical protein BGW80DRAFT_303506 [Lactifluus volemus]
MEVSGRLAVCYRLTEPRMLRTWSWPMRRGYNQPQNCLRTLRFNGHTTRVWVYSSRKALKLTPLLRQTQLEAICLITRKELQW